MTGLGLKTLFTFGKTPDIEVWNYYLPNTGSVIWPGPLELSLVSLMTVNYTAAHRQVKLVMILHNIRQQYHAKFC